MLLVKQAGGRQTLMCKRKSRILYAVLAVLLMLCACSMQENEKGTVSSGIQTELTV